MTVSATQQTEPKLTQKLGWYRGFIQGKTRIVMAWVFAILLGLFARDYPKWHGIAVCFTGASLRYWASGYLRKDTRPAVGGPYALVRNPLYLGTYLMAIGTALSIEAWWTLLAMSIFFGAVYHYIILDEETKLQRIFGEPYSKYCQTVPRFIPRLWPAPAASLEAVNPEKSHWVFSSELATKNKAYEAYVSFIGLIGYVAALAYAWQNLF